MTYEDFRPIPSRRHLNPTQEVRKAAWVAAGGKIVER
jgi:hypothetical protein